ncbi:hydrogenase nickel incorporation protein HypB [Candidatus Viridilinea mediisalina]|uniref:Hydrogenase accessory protein HypB n=1 Tax=Candidatus Viridilinea mediisalina TaxID=2024553 RepID=A0A2A6RF27_9CHLR|nr:hydrogenase nickel incorporation protein HypB [Candidatus Viridilinea mediisalina]PDW01622.1 hydrogenase accessory protein HypB [Candidatus Viridilinea mediisalina]
MKKVDVIQAILSDNNAVAEENRKVLDGVGVFGINVMASPGAGKTSMILETFTRLPEGTKLCVVEGDLASSLDAELIANKGIPVVQINTGGGCHLDASMIRNALPRLPLDEIQILMVENVGNLVCPANFLLGTHLNVVVASTPEGHDKPFKYPGMFNAADVVLINKFDLSEVFDFDLEYFSSGVRMLKPDVPIIPISCRTGAGLDEWVEWLLENR